MTFYSADLIIITAKNPTDFVYNTDISFGNAIKDNFTYIDLDIMLIYTVYEMICDFIPKSISTEHISGFFGDSKKYLGKDKRYIRISRDWGTYVLTIKKIY